MKKKILIVEDRTENVAAALEFFNQQFFHQHHIEVEVAPDFETARELLQKEIFLAAIVDVGIPGRKGEVPQRLGPEIGKLLRERATPYIYLTGGYFHHVPYAKVFLNELSLEKDEGELVADKSDPQAWKKAWKILQSLGNLEEIYEARLRFHKHVGKIYGSD